MGDDKESDTEDRKRNVKSGQGRGKDMGNIEEANEEEEKEKREKEEKEKKEKEEKEKKDTDDDDKKSDDDDSEDEGPKPMKMVINKNSGTNNAKGNKNNKKRKKLADLGASDD